MGERIERTLMNWRWWVCLPAYLLMLLPALLCDFIEWWAEGVASGARLFGEWLMAGLRSMREFERKGRPINRPDDHDIFGGL